MRSAIKKRAAERRHRGRHGPQRDHDSDDDLDDTNKPRERPDAEDPSGDCWPRAAYFPFAARSRLCEIPVRPARRD